MFFLLKILILSVSLSIACHRPSCSHVCMRAYLSYSSPMLLLSTRQNPHSCNLFEAMSLQTDDFLLLSQTYYFFNYIGCLFSYLNCSASRRFQIKAGWNILRLIAIIILSGDHFHHNSEQESIYISSALSLRFFILRPIIIQGVLHTPLSWNERKIPGAKLAQIRFSLEKQSRLVEYKHILKSVKVHLGQLQQILCKSNPL
ncbi:hypothetical protein FGO68_gene3784 [Halteria grandinella]|uniref:Secreted protein n=1 Tax=Halteria grandinella TaxID=5974 RepID=A0A8J8T165_HALGN|nr:hypothetical protein FGO68_gene3784 [Halteria grandinella]